MRPYVRYDVRDVVEDFKKAQENFTGIQIPEGNLAFTALARAQENDLHTWNLPPGTSPKMEGGLFRDYQDTDRGALMNYHPQPIVLHPNVSTYIERSVRMWLSQLLQERNLASELVGTKMMYGRADMIGRRLRITEHDGSASLMSTLPAFNPIAHSHLQGLWQQMEECGYPVRLIEHKDVVDGEQRRRSTYRHLDHMGFQELDEHEDRRLRKQVATITRAKTSDPNLREFLKTWGPSSVFLGRQRDDKDPLVAMGYAALAANRDLAIAAAKKIIETTPNKAVVLCSIEDSRTERIGIFVNKGTKRPGQSNIDGIKNKLPEDMLTLVIPFEQPTTMADEGLEYWPGDAEAVTKGHEGVTENAGEFMIPGKESGFDVGLRIFWGIEPRHNMAIVNRRSTKMSPDVIVYGGIWEAARGIIHGHPKVPTGGAYILGVNAQENAEMTAELEWAEDMQMRAAKQLLGCAAYFAT